jgi:hypothetical protein
MGGQWSRKGSRRSFRSKADAPLESALGRNQTPALGGKLTLKAIANLPLFDKQNGPVLTEPP